MMMSSWLTIWISLLLLGSIAANSASADNETFPEFANVNEANRKEASQQIQKKIEQYRQTAIQMLRAGRTENCDWKTQPISFLKGEMCGSHYKVLGLQRKGIIDKADIKKAYRQKSLNVHPDKNPAPEAASAFEVLQRAYECLNDDECAARYNYELNAMENEIVSKRNQLKDAVVKAIENAALNTYFYIIRGADYITNISNEIWDYIGQFELEILGGYHKIGQYLTMGLLLFSPARLLLQLQAIAYAIVKFNSEVMRAANRR